MTLTKQKCIRKEIKQIKLGEFQLQIGTKFSVFFLIPDLKILKDTTLQLFWNVL